MKTIAAVGAILLIAAGVWFAPGFMKGFKFTGFPGVYMCDDFGMPNNEYKKLRIDDDLAIFGSNADKTIRIGKLLLFPDSTNRATLELSNDVIHAAEFQLDPFAEHIAEGVGNSVVFSATRENKLLYSKPCFKK